MSQVDMWPSVRAGRYADGMSGDVGVVVRTKDRPGFLARALVDIADQTFSDVRVVVVNDQGDPDAVTDVIRAAPTGLSVTAVHLTAGGGRCVAANAGISELDTEYVVLHDDDDLWHPEFLARTAAHLSTHLGDAGVMVPTEIVLEERRGETWVETSREPFWEGLERVTFSNLLLVNRAVPISFLYRRALHDEIGGYNESLDAVEDWEFNLRVAARHSIGFLAGPPLAYWMQRPAARGAEANSMFEIAALHDRDDELVRDAALREWVATNGPGLPLYIAAVERRLSNLLREEMAAQRSRMVSELYAQHPLWRRLRALRRRFLRPRR